MPVLHKFEIWRDLTSAGPTGFILKKVVDLDVILFHVNVCIFGVFQFITDALCFCHKGKLKQMRAQTKKHQKRNRKKIMIITEVMNRYCWNITFELSRTSSCSFFWWFKTAFLSEGISRCVALTPRILSMLSG